MTNTPFLDGGIGYLIPNDREDMKQNEVLGKSWPDQKVKVTVTDNFVQNPEFLKKQREKNQILNAGQDFKK